jgi:hypothetical protein
MNKWAELFTGLILLVGILLIAWFSAQNGWMVFGKSFNLLNSAWIVFKGFLFWTIFFVGLLLIILGISNLKD